MEDVKNLVYSMLTENTGKHFLDSGGTDGRNWQRNVKKSMQDFEEEEEELYQYDNKYNEIYRTVSVYHFLTNNLELNDICEDFNQLQNDSDNWGANADVYGVSSEAWSFLTDCFDVEIKHTFNTYNSDSDLSQILQGSMIEINRDTYYLIQVHNGADARGGYTYAKLFKCGDYCEGMIHEYLREYKDSYEIEQDINEGYISEFVDYWDYSITYTNEYVKNKLELN